MQNQDASCLSITIKKMVSAQIRLFTPLYGEGAFKEDLVPIKHADKVDVLLDALNDIIFLLESFGMYFSAFILMKNRRTVWKYIYFDYVKGPYGAFHCASVNISILQVAKTRAKVPQCAVDLEKVNFLSQQIRYYPRFY